MASTYPYARWKPLGAQTEGLMTAHDIVCVHTMAGYLISTDQFFRVTNGPGYAGTEAHYGIGGKWGPDLGGDLDGSVWQWQDRARRADANYDGNHRVISIETADNAVRPIQPWTPAQLAALIRLIAWECSRAAHADCPASWACHQDGIPAALIPDTLPGRRGLAYHAQGAADWTAGEWWSTTRSKDCPTAARITQLRQTVIPGVVAAMQPGTELFMSLSGSEEQEVLRAARNINSAVGAGQLTYEGTIEATLGGVQRLVNLSNAMDETIDAIKADTALSDKAEEHVLARIAEAQTAILAALLLPNPPPAAA